MVEQHELPDPGLRTDGRGMLPRGVPPPDVLRVRLRGEERVHREHVRPLAERHDPVVPVRQVLVIGEVHEPLRPGLELEPHRLVRMVQLDGLHRQNRHFAKSSESGPVDIQ